MQPLSWLISTTDYFEYCSNALVLMPLTIAVWRWASQPMALRVLATALASSASLVAAISLLHPAPAAEGLLWHLYTVLQTLLIGGVYIFAFRATAFQRRIEAALLVFLLLAVADWCWLEHGQMLHMYTHIGQGLLLPSLAGLYLHQLAKEMRIQRLEYDPLFLVSSGVVMYFSATAMLYGIAHNFIPDADVVGQHVISLLISLVNLVQYSLFALAFYRAPGPFSLSPRVHE